MTSTISDGTTTVTPLQILGYESKRPSRNIRHAILATNVPAFSLRPAGLREGTLEALMPDRAAAVQLETLLAQDKLFTFTDATASLSMTFALDGEITVGLDMDSTTLWVVQFGYTEAGT